MKFSNLAVLTVVAPLAAGFTTTSNQRHFAAKNVAFVKSSAPSSTRRGAMSMDLSDLEKRLLDPVEEKKPRSKPKPEKKKPSKAPAPAPAPAPVKAGKVSYDLGGIETVPKAKKEAPAPKPKAEKPKPAPKAKKPTPKPPAPKPAVTTVKDPNAVPAGIAAGAAPLVLAPVALLAAGRGILGNTKARREKIQAEIAAFEAAKKKKEVSADVDGAGLATALVRNAR